MYSPFGKVVRVLLNKTKEATGSAYVTFSREEDARNAIIAKDNCVVDGVTLRY
jgi:RNA recognition motif-containing protein